MSNVSINGNYARRGDGPQKLAGLMSQKLSFNTTVAVIVPYFIKKVVQSLPLFSHKQLKKDPSWSFSPIHAQAKKPEGFLA